MKLGDVHPCDGCGGLLPVLFNRVVLDTLVVDNTAVQQLQALSGMLGSAKLADAFGSRDVAKPFDPPVTLLFCWSCLVECRPLVRAVERHRALLSSPPTPNNDPEPPETTP